MFNRKILIFICLLFLLLFSCREKDEQKFYGENTNIRDSLKILNDSISKLASIVNGNAMKNSTPSQSFNEFANQFVINVPKSINYFMNNSEDYISFTTDPDIKRNKKVKSIEAFKKIEFIM